MSQYSYQARRPSVILREQKSGIMDQPKGKEAVNFESVEAFADSEYSSYQAHTTNILMMGTLVFGFCVTGTFLSVTFTGHEPFIKMDYLVSFVTAGLRATFFSLGASCIAFVISTRAASRYLSFGAVAALRTIHRTIIFVGAAEIMIYFSVYFFLASINEYAHMNYMGPEICPANELSNGAETWSNSSFCAQLGDDLYGAATERCEPARPVTWHVDKKHCAASNRSKSDAQPFVLCSVFDCYTASGLGPNWFGWDDPDDTQRLAFIYDKLHQEDKYMNNREAWNLVAKDSAETMCRVDKFREFRDSVCALGTSPSASQISVCSQAEHTYLEADHCAGQRQDEAVRCRKVCQGVRYDQWFGPTSEVPLKSRIGRQLRWYSTIFQTILVIIILCRAFANIVLAIRCCRALFSDQNNDWLPGDELWREVMRFSDVLGMFDSLTKRRDAGTEARRGLLVGLESSEASDEELSDVQLSTRR